MHISAYVTHHVPLYAAVKGTKKCCHITQDFECFDTASTVRPVIVIKRFCYIQLPMSFRLCQFQPGRSILCLSHSVNCLNVAEFKV